MGAASVRIQAIGGGLLVTGTVPTAVAAQTVEAIGHAYAGEGVTLVDRLFVLSGIIERALGGKPDTIIPELGRRMIGAVNLGVPALQRVPALGNRPAGLVRDITGLGASAAPACWLRRMLRS